MGLSHALEEANSRQAQPKMQVARCSVFQESCAEQAVADGRLFAVPPQRDFEPGRALRARYLNMHVDVSAAAALNAPGTDALQQKYESIRISFAFEEMLGNAGRPKKEPAACAVAFSEFEKFWNSLALASTQSSPLIMPDRSGIFRNRPASGTWWKSAHEPELDRHPRVRRCFGAYRLLRKSGGNHRNVR